MSKTAKPKQKQIEHYEHHSKGHAPDEVNHYFNVTHERIHKI